MFCPKCGAKAPDDAGFCQKCGAKLAPSDTTQPTTDSTANPVKQGRGASGNAPKKKKKLPIILGVAVALVLLLVFFASTGRTGICRAESQFSD